MINELDNNKRSLNAMSDLEFAKNETEMMRYRPNTLSHKLGLGGLAFSVLAAFICLNSFNPRDFQVILIILMNIAILLFGFLCCEKAKAYSREGSIGLVGLGVACGLRIFWVPLNIIIAFAQYDPLAKELISLNEQKAAGTAGLDSQIEEVTAKISNLTNGPWIGKTIVDGYDSSSMPVAILSSNGFFRGVTAIVFLVFAAGLFIAAGIIGMIQTKKLTNYMASLNQKK